MDQELVRANLAKKVEEFKLAGDVRWFAEYASEVFSFAPSFHKVGQKTSLCMSLEQLFQRCMILFSTYLAYLIGKLNDDKVPKLSFCMPREGF